MLRMIRVHCNSECNCNGRFEARYCLYKCIIVSIHYYENNNNIFHPNWNVKMRIADLFKAYATLSRQTDGVKAIENAIKIYPEYEGLWNATRILM